MVQDRVHVSRADTVHSNSVPCPLSCERAFEQQQRAFRNIVRHLWLREVDTMSRDRGYEEDAATGLLFYHLTIHERGMRITITSSRKIARLPSDSLCAEPASGRVGIERPLPLVETQLESVCAGHHARETQ